MTTETTSGTDLLVFVDSDQTIWFEQLKQEGIASRRVTQSDLSVADFISQDWVKSASRVKLLGLATNADIICELHYGRQTSSARLPRSIQVGTPAVCSSAKVKSAEQMAEYVFAQMTTLQNYSASCGGWHEVTSGDYISYNLVRELRNTGEKYTGKVPAILRAHPAWPAVSFIPTVNEAQAAIMLAHIIDPRWYIDPRNPNRIGKLRNFMGLWEQNMRAIAAAVHYDTDQFARAMSLWLSWSSGPNTSSKKLSDPESFLFQKLANSQTKHRGMLKASALYLNLVRTVWLDNVTDNVELFIPDYFFSEPREAAAYKAHALRLKDAR